MCFIAHRGIGSQHRIRLPSIAVSIRSVLLLAVLSGTSLIIIAILRAGAAAATGPTATSPNSSSSSSSRGRRRYTTSRPLLTTGSTCRSSRAVITATLSPVSRGRSAAASLISIASPRTLIGPSRILVGLLDRAV